VPLFLKIPEIPFFTKVNQFCRFAKINYFFCKNTHFYFHDPARTT
jgi:hypothetical protein